MYSKRYARLFERKLSVSLAILLVYILGCNIPMPWIVRTAQKAAEAGSISSFQAQGLDISAYEGISRVPILMLGFSPWLRAKIIMQIVRILFRLKNLSASTMNLLSDFLAIAFGSYMAVTVLNSGYYTSTLAVSPLLWKLFACVCMITGLFVIIWLAGRNAERGLGGSSFLILVNIIRNLVVRWKADGMTLAGALAYLSSHRILAAIGAAYLIILLLLMVTMQRTQVRLEVHRAMIQSLEEQKSYFAVQLNPSGGMAVMFASVVYELLYLLSRNLYSVFPKVHAIRYIAEYGSLDYPVGIASYLIVLFAMTIIFSWITIDAERIADDWRKAGDYIIGVRPGKATERVIRRTVTLCSIFSGIVLMAVLAVPMVSGLYSTEVRGLHSLCITFIIMTGLMLSLFDEARMMLSFKDYTTLL